MLVRMYILNHFIYEIYKSNIYKIYLSWDHEYKSSLTEDDDFMSLLHIFQSLLDYLEYNNYIFGTLIPGGNSKPTE